MYTRNGFFFQGVFKGFLELKIVFRRASNDTYSEDTDEHKGTNMLIMTDENFTNIEVDYQKLKNISKKFFLRQRVLVL